MTPLRPIGHVAATLSVVALSIAHRLTHTPPGAVLVCWRTDDGCLYAQQASHPVARAIERTAPQLIVNRYRKQPGFGWRDIATDLEQARLDFAAQALAEAMAEAMAA